MFRSRLVTPMLRHIVPAILLVILSEKSPWMYWGKCGNWLAATSCYQKGSPVDSNFFVFDVSVFYDSVSLCLYGSVSLCLWEEGVAATYAYFLGGSVA